jgi:hypothetical protein
MKLRPALALIALTLATFSPLWAEEIEAIRNIRYTTTEQVLTITFGDGSRYTYAAVPAAVAEELEKAESKGEAFNRLIKGKYVGTKIVVE